VSHPVRLLAPALAACALLLAACGGSSGAPAGGDGSGVAPVPDPGGLSGTTGTVAGSDLTPAEAAAAAALQPVDGAVRPELQPLPAAAFRRPVARYRAYALGHAHGLEAETDRIVAALRGDDRAGARAAWLAAYDRYLRIGAAYGALGDLDEAVDGLPGQHPGGVHDPRFTGLHRVEAGLWGGEPAAATLPWAERLARDARRVTRALRTLRIPPLDYATRAHEILEDAQRDQLSGDAAGPSGAGLRATASDLAATDEVLATLRPVLAGRGDALAAVDTGRHRLHATLDALRRAHGGALPRLDDLTVAERERTSGALGQLLEALSAVPGALETQIPPVPPSLGATGSGRIG